ncbi:fatty acid CoA ligase family protein [Thalassoroseus pseudoceratinae]|uniref:fatty acid CoA ligase family protein n=1 Tax=Thalassoroseus pseudoceratinae TaxID=2713176 RepID=UPI00142271B2|nr:fatty acid CoA ligase family protein [Thalassoroseus pseudoceratinae]
MPLNIADRLRQSAKSWPDQRAVVFPQGKDRLGRTSWTHLTFRQLDDESEQLAKGLVQLGLQKGDRIVLMVRPSLEFIALTFALFKAGAVIVLIDPGMGPRNVFRCLTDVTPKGFVAIRAVQVIRALRRKLFPEAKLNVTVGGKLPWGGPTYESLLAADTANITLPTTEPNDPAAIIFTSGSTGPAKGVLYAHRMFDAQVDLLREFYDIQPGEIDLPGFPLFALFNSAMGVTTVVPDMDPTRPANVNPKKIIAAIQSQGVTQAFGSPAMWNRIGRYLERHDIKLPSIRRILSAGAPVPPHVLKRMKAALNSNADIHTPYGATESLPIASISGSEVLGETVEKTRHGAGTCVGQLFPNVTVKIIEIVPEAIATLDDAKELPVGEIGEIIVQAPSTTREYVDRPEPTAKAKILDADGQGFWHRMGDVGYIDESGRLWFCGRKAHIVETEAGRLFSVRCEAIFNEHPKVYRSALVGIGKPGSQVPAIIIEPEDGHFPQPNAEDSFRHDLRELGQANELTKDIHLILFHRSFPVDVRHNIKINREILAVWAENNVFGNQHAMWKQMDPKLPEAKPS